MNNVAENCPKSCGLCSSSETVKSSDSEESADEYSETVKSDQLKSEQFSDEYSETVKSSHKAHNHSEESSDEYSKQYKNLVKEQEEEKLRLKLAEEDKNRQTICQKLK